MYDDDYIILDDFDDDVLPSRKRRRWSIIIFALIMIFALVGGAILQAWSAVPALLGYWRSEYSLVFTEVRPGDCNSPALPETGGLLCICGLMDAGQGDADVDIEVQTPDGATLGSLALRGQNSGPFCRAMNLKNRLEPGQYILIGKPRLSRDTIARVIFTIPDNRPSA